MTVYKTPFAIAAILLASLSSGCTSFGDANISPNDVITLQNPALNVASWSEQASNDLPDTKWIESFDSDELSGVIEEALNANTDVRSALARLEASRAAAISSRAPLFPNINGSVNANRTEFRNNLQPDTTIYSARPTVNWELDVWGRVRDTATVGDLNADISLADYAATRLLIAGATADAWFNLIESKLQLELAERDVKTRTRAASLTERRFNGGLSPSADVRLARTSAASAKAALATRKQLRTASARQLEVLLRRYPSAQIGSPSDLPALPPLSGSGNPIDIYSKRPDLLAAASQLQVAGLQVDIAQKNLLPQLTLNADANFSNPSFDDLFDTENMVLSLLAGLSGPIFNAGALRADVERNEALLRLQVESYVSTAINAYFEVENALNAEVHLLEREEALRESLEEAEQAESRTLQRYSEGLATILELLDAQTRAIDAESQLISARTERLQNRVRFHLALGGGDLGDTVLLEETIEKNK